ncbi:hypothetical protein BDZ89DRAFT_1134834 [Hymenopellis radicata]|nr:hypothetical protein BDZ89DRAFT_1134834 [Hymenopellis radicata]
MSSRLIVAGIPAETRKKPRQADAHLRSSHPALFFLEIWSSIPAPLPPSTVKNKNVTDWGHEWFKTKLTNLKAQGETEGEAVCIADVFDVDGDVELDQRKSKTLFWNQVKLLRCFMQELLGFGAAMSQGERVEPFLIERDEIYHLACPASPPHYQFNSTSTSRTLTLLFTPP